MHWRDKERLDTVVNLPHFVSCEYRIPPPPPPPRVAVEIGGRGHTISKPGLAVFVEVKPPAQATDSPLPTGPPFPILRVDSITAN